MWVKKVPEKDGYYWVHAKGILTGKSYVHPVKLYTSGDTRTVFSDGENFPATWGNWVEWWDEEIPMPAGSPRQSSPKPGTIYEFRDFS